MCLTCQPGFYDADDNSLTAGACERKYRSEPSHHPHNQKQWRIHGFPGEGANPEGGGIKLFRSTFFPKTA